MSTLNFKGYGMLWLLPKDFEQRKADAIRDAVKYYQEKYDKTPDIVLVHPNHMPLVVSGVSIEQTSYMLISTILVGHK